MTTIFIALCIIVLIKVLRNRNGNINTYNRNRNRGWDWNTNPYNQCDEVIIDNDNEIWSVTSAQRGNSSEHSLITRLLRYGINRDAIFHDLYFHHFNNQYAQTDVVIATKVGIIVFEVKDYSGWIYGNGNQQNWTQVLSYGKEKHKFYNPILQNKTHIKVIKQQLSQFDSIPFFSVIVFFGNCRLKEITNVPHNTYVIYSYDIHKTLDEIINNNPVAPYTNKTDIVNTLKEGVKNGENPDIVQNHINNLQQYDA